VLKFEFTNFPDLKTIFFAHSPKFYNKRLVKKNLKIQKNYTISLSGTFFFNSPLPLCECILLDPYGMTDLHIRKCHKEGQLLFLFSSIFCLAVSPLTLETFFDKVKLAIMKDLTNFIPTRQNPVTF